MSIITISGTPGSGKSTVAELLEKQLDIPYIYSGMIFRSLAEKHGMSLADFGRYCEEDEQVDRELDDKQVELLKKGNVILEGRLAGWLAFKNQINALKVMIDAPVLVRAERIVQREQGTVEDQKRIMIQREKSEKKRYLNYYDIDVSDTSIYDLVIDSSDKTPDEIVDIIIKRFKE